MLEHATHPSVSTSGKCGSVAQIWSGRMNQYLGDGIRPVLTPAEHPTLSVSRHGEPDRTGAEFNPFSHGNQANIFRRVALFLPDGRA